MEYFAGVKLQVYFFGCSRTEFCHCHYQHRTYIRISWVHNWTYLYSGGCKVGEELPPEFVMFMS